MLWERNLQAIPSRKSSTRLWERDGWADQEVLKFITDAWGIDYEIIAD